MSGDHPNYCIIEIVQNTEKSSGDLRRLVVPQTLVRNHQLTLVWKTLKKEYNNNNNNNNNNNFKYRFCADREETIHHIISKCSNLAQKENKKKHNWVGKVIHWERCKKFKFDHTNKWYIHNPASVLENETHKLLWDFERKMDHLISARRLDSEIIIKKRTCRILNFAVPADHRVKLKESEKKDNTSTLPGNLKTVEHEIDVYTNCNWCSWYSH